jgi:type I restriction-modification system DNA methylase subunit
MSQDRFSFDGRTFLEPLRARELAERAKTRPDWSARHDAARRWIAAFQANDIASTKEKSLQASFFHRVFVDVLGYTDQGSSVGSWTLEPEPTTDINSRFADGRLGFFSARSPAVTRVVIELKDALTDLDAKQMSRRDRLSPVEQALMYLLSYETAAFAIVCNFVKLRLYSKKFGMARYHEFDVTRINERDALADLLALCARETLLGDDASSPSPLEGMLLEGLPAHQRDITATFYAVYASKRDRIAHWLRDNRPDIDPVATAQKLLNRILFIAYAEDVGLLPQRILATTLDHGAASRSRSPTKVWEQLRFLFEDIDKGRGDLSPAINRYNGGLFRHDPDVDDKTALPDDLVLEFRDLAQFDFATELDVNILGHVFETSLADVTTLRRALTLRGEEPERDPATADAVRKRLGVFYTRAWVTHFIVDQTVGRFLQEHGPEARHRLRVLDPACGSGAFLSETLSYLERYIRAVRLARSHGRTELFGELAAERASTFLPQIFGIDLLAESVEITKLSLWLKSVIPTEPLDSITTVEHANTLTTPTASEGYASTAVYPVVRGGGFEVVVGNPPWGAILDYEVDPALTQEGQVDSYELFLERALRDLLAPGGFFGFIVPDRILRPEGERTRRVLFDEYRVLLVAKLGEGVFDDVYRASVIVVAAKEPPAGDDRYLGVVLVRADRDALDKTGSAQLTTIVEQRGGPISASRVRSDPHYNIALSADVDLQIVDCMRAGAAPWISDDGVFGQYGRGEELGPDSFTVQCPACFDWSIGPGRRAKRRGGGYDDKECPKCCHVFSVAEAIGRREVVAPYRQGDSTRVAMVTGEQVNRYWIGTPLGLLLGVPGVAYKPHELYEGAKLLIRQTGVGIYAALDRSDLRCTQSVYVYKVRDVRRDGEPEWYLAQLVSRAMLFCFFVMTNQIEWQSFPKLTHATLQQLPLRRPDLRSRSGRATHDEIVELVRKRSEIAARGSGHVTSEALRVDQEIEKAVMDVYALTPDARARINSRLRPAQNIRVIRELYPEGLRP